MAKPRYPMSNGPLRPKCSLSGLDIHCQNICAIEKVEVTDPKIIGPIANPTMNILVPAATIISTLTPNSLAVTPAAALKTLDANVVVRTYSAMDMVMSHLRQRGRFCGLPASPDPYQPTR